MVILSMTATFGRLEQARLELKDGLNLLEMPNESGKSTWCAFLRAMFYGLESRKGGALSERNRFTPWSGAAMAGEMDLLWQGKAITLRRWPKGSDPFGNFQAVYTGTAEAVPGLTAANAGEVLLGMTKEVFQRTCLIPQGGLTVDASGDLERRIAALASAGEEDVSFSDAEARLRDWRNQRQSNRAVGTLPKLRTQLMEVQDRRRRLLDAQARQTEAAATLEELALQRREAEADLLRHQALREAEALAQARQRYEAAAQRLAQAEDALADTHADAREARAALPQPPKSAASCRLPLVLGILLGCVPALLAGLKVLPLLPFLPLALLPAAAGLGATLVLTRRRGVAAAAYAKALALLQTADSALEAAQAQHIAAQAAWEAISAQGEPPAPPSVEDRPRRTLAEDQARLERAKSGIAQCQDRIARAQGEAEALGGLAPMDQAQAELEERIAREETELAALNLALEALTAANAQLQTRFSPALNAKAGALLSRLTGGRYDHLTFTRQFEAMAQTELGPKSAALLSQGTADQTYLALRLAICLLALPGEEPAPLVLDDALVAFDDARLKLALDLLCHLAQDRQILLFTCQGREGACLRDGPCNFPLEPV